MAVGRSLGDPRLSAFVALSPSPARDGRDPRESFGQVQKPVMCMTGTKDRSVINRDVTPEMRRTVYRALAPGDKYELVLDKAEHGAFGNRRLPGERGNPRYHAAILRITTAFWDAYLRGDAQAKAWLQSDTAREVLVKEDVWGVEVVGGAQSLDEFCCGLSPDDVRRPPRRRPRPRRREPDLPSPLASGLMTVASPPVWGVDSLRSLRRSDPPCFFCGSPPWFFGSPSPDRRLLRRPPRRRRRLVPFLSSLWSPLPP